MTQREKQADFEIMEAKLILFAWEKLGLKLVRLEWLRSSAQQAINVAKGLSETMESDHCVGLASDFCFLGDILDDGKINWDLERYRPLGEYWESLGGRWGGRFGQKQGKAGKLGWDCGHFEYGPD